MSQAKPFGDGLGLLKLILFSLEIKLAYLFEGLRRSAVCFV